MPDLQTSRERTKYEGSINLVPLPTEKASIDGTQQLYVKDFLSSHTVALLSVTWQVFKPIGYHVTLIMHRIILNNQKTNIILSSHYRRKKTKFHIKTN